MNDQGIGAGEPGRTPEEIELFHRVTEMLAPQNNPPEQVVELAKQSFALRAVDAELAALVADSAIQGTAEAVRRSPQFSAPRLLTFETGELVVELQVDATGSYYRILGELVPAGRASIEVRQPGSDTSRTIDTDEDGRFVVDGVLPAPFSLTCRRPGRGTVNTEWTSLD